MWKKGELVWANIRYPHTWLPGRVLDPSESFGVLVSFFDLMEPRYFPAIFLRRFDRHFGALFSASDSRKLHRFVRRALQTHFRNISYSLWCSCQPAIVSPHFDRENSLPWFPLCSDSVLGFVGNVAVSLPVPMEGLADASCFNAQILSFRRYIVDFERSEVVYREIKASASLMDQPEAQDLSPHISKDMEFLAFNPIFPETAGLDMGNNEVMSVRDSLRKKIPGFSSSEQAVEDGKVQILDSRNLSNHLADSDTSNFLKACNTMAWSVKRDNGYLSMSANRDFVELGNCKLNAEAAVKDKMDEDTNIVRMPEYNYGSSTGFHTADSEAALDHMIETSENIINSNDGNVTSLQQLPHSLDVRNDQAGPIEPTPCVAPEAWSNGNNSKSINIKRKAGVDVASRNSFKEKRVAQQSAFVDKPLNPPNQVAQKVKARYMFDSRCLRMMFLRSHGFPTKGDLMKKFSAFGRIDASRTDVYPCNRSAKIVFLQSIDAVAAYEYAKSKNVSFGQSKVLYRLDPIEQDTEGNKVSTSWRPRAPTLKSCLKKQTLVDKGAERRNLKVRFRIETNG